MNLYIEVSSFLFNNIEKFSEVISLFDIKFIEDNCFFDKVKRIFQELTKFREINFEKVEEKLLLNLDFIISFGYLIFPNVKLGIDFISKSAYKEKLINAIMENLEYFKENIYIKPLLSLLLTNCKKMKIF